MRKQLIIPILFLSFFILPAYADEDKDDKKEFISKEDKKEIYKGLSFTSLKIAFEHVQKEYKGNIIEISLSKNKDIYQLKVIDNKGIIHNIDYYSDKNLLKETDKPKDKTFSLIEKRNFIKLEKILEKVNSDFKNSKIIEAELDEDDRIYFYEIKLLDNNGFLYELKYNAVTGKLIKKK